MHPTVILTVQTTPADCLRAIAEAARPSLHRLHLRNLFTDGRRYHLQPLKDGFQMTSNSKIPWRRARTSVAAVIFVELKRENEGATRIRMKARMRLFYFLDIFFIPLFISSILFFAPWHKLLIAGLSLILFALSWIGHRLTAALQATDAVYFVQKALEDIVPVEAPKLPAGEPEIITQHREFRQEWQKFYREHQSDG